MPNRPGGSMPLRETELYAPVRDYLVLQGYDVRGEVSHCDVVATKGDEMIVVELKRRLTLELLGQACDRQRLCASVYVAVPAPACAARAWRQRMRLLRRLELGLITIDVAAAPPRVTVEFHPLPYVRQVPVHRRRAVLREVQARTGDYNAGGATRTKVVTAFRERAIHIACCLERFGPLTPKQLRDLDTGPKTLAVLRSSFYTTWFERIDRGVYALKAGALAEMQPFAAAVEACRRRIAGAGPP